MLLRSLLPLFPALTYGCGVLIHSEITRRALHHISQPAEDASSLYYDIVDNIPLILPSLRLGSFFPDWGYNCLPGTSDASEAAHWPPFLQAAVYQLHKTYGTDSSNWSDDAWSLVGVILGISGHGSSDVTWHSLNMVGGFMKLVAEADFDGDFAQAHNLVDPGGDFTLAAALINASKDEDWEATDWHKGDWTIPNQDLIEIYRILGYKVTANQLKFCASRGLAALQTELVIGKEVFAEFRDKSPTTVANLETYYLGGIRQMVGDAVECWVGIIGWIEGKVPTSEKDAWKYCTVFKAFLGWDYDKKAGPRPKDLPSLKTVFSPEIEKSISEVLEHIQEETFGGRTTLRLDMTVNDEKPKRKQINLLRSSGYDEPVYLTANVPFSHFGSSLAYGMFQEGWETPILSVGAPYESESYMLPHSGGAYQIPLDGLASTSAKISSKSKLITNSTRAADGEEPDVPILANNLFGYAQTTWAPIEPLQDLLVINSPGPLTYPGAYDRSSGGAVTVFHKGLKVWEFKSYGGFMGQIGWKEFGTTLVTGHLGASLLNAETLLMASPESDVYYFEDEQILPHMREGFVYLCWLQDAGAGEASRRKLPAAYWEHEARNSNLTISDALTRSFLRKAQTAAAKNDEGPVLELEYRRLNTPSNLNLTRFGQSATFTQRSKVLFVSSPSSGVFLYDFAAAEYYQPPRYKISPPTTTANPPKTEFGYAMVSGFDEKTNNEWIAVSAPSEDEYRGAVYVYTFSYETAHGKANHKLVKRLFDSQGEKYTKFGLVLKTDGARRLVIASPEANSFRGAVWEVEIDIEKWSSEVPASVSYADGVASAWLDRKQSALMGSKGVRQGKLPTLPGAEKGLGRAVEGVYPNSRLGASVVFPGDLNGDGKEDLVLGMPGSGVDGGKGAVAVLFKL